MIGLFCIGGDFDMNKKATAGIVVVGIVVYAAIATMVYSKASVR